MSFPDDLVAVGTTVELFKDTEQSFFLLLKLFNDENLFISIKNVQSVILLMSVGKSGQCFT